MSDYEYEAYESYEEEPGDVEAETYSEETDETSDYVSEYSGIHRILLLLIIVLVIGVVLLGLFIAIRPAGVPMPTLRPPWLV